MATPSSGGHGRTRSYPGSRSASAEVRDPAIVSVVAIGQLFLWSAKRGEWTNCPHEEITWLDRELLSGNEDLTLHRAPRCAGLRYVHHDWELFSRDMSHQVYLAPDP